MSSVSMAGGCSAAMFSIAASRTTDAAKMQQLFSKLDTNGDNSIDSSELQSFAAFISDKSGASVDAAALLTSLDSDGNGAVSATELTDNSQALLDQLRDQLMSAKLEARPQRPDPAEMFSRIDSDSDGSISKTELDSFLAQGPGDGPDAAEVLARDDADGDGSISADEFASAVKQGPGGPPPPREDGLSRMLSSLLEQYGAVDSSASSSGQVNLAA